MPSTRFGFVVLLFALVDNVNGQTQEQEIISQYGPLLCENPEDFTPNKVFNEGTCGTVIPQYLANYASLTSLTGDQCNTVLAAGQGPFGQDITVRAAVRMAGADCCGNGGAAELCGAPSILPICKNMDNYLPSNLLGENHCQGDEHKSRDECVAAAGEEAYDETENEPCDVGRMPGDAAAKEAACTALGATWTPPETCGTFVGYMAAYDVPLSEETCNDPLFDFGTQATFMMYAGMACCKDMDVNDMCTSNLLNPCKHETNFRPGNAYQSYCDGVGAENEETCAQAGGTWRTTSCLEAQHYYTSTMGLEFSADTCNDLVPDAGDTTHSLLYNMMGMMCCAGGDINPVCGELPNPCMDTSDFDPHALLSDDSSSTCGQETIYRWSMLSSANVLPDTPLCHYTASECAIDLSPYFGVPMDTINVEGYIGYLGSTCCRGGATTTVCTEPGSVSCTKNVACGALMALYRQKSCCYMPGDTQVTESGTCTDLKTYYTEANCCGQPSMEVLAPPFWSN